MGIILHAVIAVVGVFAFFASIFALVQRAHLWRIFWRTSADGKSPSVSIIMAARSMDERLEGTIKSLGEQKYAGKYEVILVSDDDAKLFARMKRLTRSMKRFRVFMSGPASSTSGKIVALRMGISKARHSVLAFCDSDEKLPGEWLSQLVAHLDGATASTGYRIYAPRSFRSSLLSAWNMIGLAQSMRSPYIIGGSWAIRKKDFTALKISDSWNNSITEDATADAAIKKRKHAVAFAPRAVVCSEYSNVFSRVFEFTTRQVCIIKWYNNRLWRGALTVFALTRILVLIIFAMAYMYVTTGNPVFLAETALFSLPVVMGFLRALIDRANQKKIVGGHVSGIFSYILADFCAQWLMTYNLLRSVPKNSIEWRGRKYTVGERLKIEENQ